MSGPVVRVSILRGDASNFARLRQMMVDADPVLRPGILALPGLLSFHAGVDEAALALINNSLWTSLAHAQQLDGFQPMLDQAREFAAAGATFERPILNFATLWSFGALAEAD